MPDFQQKDKNDTSTNVSNEAESSQQKMVNEEIQYKGIKVGIIKTTDYFFNKS